MNKQEKLEMVKNMLDDTDVSDKKLSSFLDFAEITIIDRLYSLVTKPENVKLPSQYDSIQINAVVIGWNMRGAENETTHNENSVNRSYQYSSMVEYINKNVNPYVRVVG